MTAFQLTDEVKASKRCAIARKGLTAPLRSLLPMLASGVELDVLHLGEGRAVYDTKALRKRFGQCEVFDPNFSGADDQVALANQYDIIWCCYVANVLPPEDRKRLYAVAAACTKGRTYITVRRDKIKGEPEQDGVRTSKGTFQRRYTELDLFNELDLYFESVYIVDRGAGWLTAECMK